MKQKRWREKRENGKKDARNRMKIVEGEACECKECEKRTKDSIGDEQQKRPRTRKRDGSGERMMVLERRKKLQGMEDTEKD